MTLDKTLSKCPNYLKMSQLSQNMPTISKCPNLLAQNVPTDGKYAGWLNLCEIMRKMLKYTKMCSKQQIICEKLGKMTNCAIPQPLHLNVAPVLGGLGLERGAEKFRDALQRTQHCHIMFSRNRGYAISYIMSCHI